jgi:hypothetical protein
LIKILRAGPEVSFNGSPTVSPTTAALCSSVPLALTVPLIVNYPPSIYFLALSQAPPELALEVAIATPETIAPGNNPATARGPRTTPKTKGVHKTRAPGATILLKEASVEIAIHL